MTAINHTLNFFGDTGRGLDQFGTRDGPPTYLKPILQALAGKQVVAIASDASFKGLPRMIGDNFRTGARPPSETNAAIIIADDHFNRQAGNRQAAAVITVTGLTSLPGSASASKSESIASMVGLQIQRWLGNSPLLYTDCRAVVTGTRLMDPLLHNLGM